MREIRAESQPISILKPLKGLDSGLQDNLKSFFEIRYPQFEILFAVQNPNDPAIGIVQSLMNTYPQVQASLHISETETIQNPKVNNLSKVWQAARYSNILISDSNTRVSPQFLEYLSSRIGDPEVGVISSVVVGMGAENLWAATEAVYLNGHCTRGMLFAEWMKKAFVVGKLMLFRKENLLRIGGLKTLGLYLAEDYVTGEAMKKLGLGVILSDQPIQQYLGKYHLKDFIGRHLRWSKMRRAQTPLVFPMEILVHSFSLTLLASAAFHSWTAGLYLYLSLFAIDLLQCKRLDSIATVPNFAGIKFCFLFPGIFMKDLLTFLIYPAAYLNSTVHWRGRSLKLSNGGLLDSKV